METKNKQIQEIINSDMSFISGDEPEYDNGVGTNFKTTDKMANATSNRATIFSRYGLSYVLFEDDEITNDMVEQVLPKITYEENDVITAEPTEELPSIYSISNINLSTKLKSVVSILKTTEDDQDKVAVLAEILRHVDLKNIPRTQKKQLLKLIQERF
jgi:hypothetical protein